MFDGLRAGGVDFPATVVCELEIRGYAIERAYDRGWLVGVRLLEPESRDTTVTIATRRRHRAWSPSSWTRCCRC
jgi:hypothetical protein